MISNLWEVELVFEELFGVCLEGWLCMACFLELLCQSNSAIVVLHVQSLAEQIPFVLHFVDIFVNVTLALLLESSHLLLFIRVRFLDLGHLHVLLMLLLEGLLLYCFVIS